MMSRPLATAKHQRSQSGCSPDRGAPGVMAGRLVQINYFRAVQCSTAVRFGRCDLHLPCKLDAGRRSSWRTAGRCDACTQSCMMTGHLCGSRSPPAALAVLLTAWWSWARVLLVPPSLGDEVKTSGTDVGVSSDMLQWTWRGGTLADGGSVEAVSVIAGNQFHFTMQTPGLRAASVGGPWLAASQSNTFFFYHICSFLMYDGLYGQVLCAGNFCLQYTPTTFPSYWFLQTGIGAFGSAARPAKGSQALLQKKRQFEDVHMMMMVSY